MVTDKNFDNALSRTSTIMHVLFLSPVLLYVGAYIAGQQPGFQLKSIEGAFALLFFLSTSTIPLMGWLYQHLMCLPKLEEKAAKKGIKRAFNSFRTGIFVNAALGDLCASAGLIYWVATGETEFLWPFVLGWGVHYILASVWLTKASSDIKLLDRSLFSSQDGTPTRRSRIS